MKILIISATYGNGHMSATNSLTQMLNNNFNNIEVIVCSPIEEEAYYLHKVINYSYNKFYTKKSHISSLKFIYNTSYKIFDNSISSKLSSLTATPFIKKTINKYQPDLIIQTFPLNTIKKQSVPNLVFITDYGINKLWISNLVDHYFVATQDMKMTLMKHNIKANNISISGIPIRKEFNQKNSQKINKNILISLGNNLSFITDKFIDQIKEYSFLGYMFTIITGHNKNMAILLNNRLENCTNIDILGFVTNMEDYLNKADIIITKAGGISISEAIHSETPMIINKSITLSGQENYNLKYIKQNNLGYITTSDQIIVTAINCINNLDDYNQLVTNIQNQKIYHQEQLIIKQLKKYLEMSKT